MLLALLKIGLGIHKFLANEGRRLTTSSWKRTTIADRISSIRHLNSIRQRTIRELDREIINNVSFTKFQVNRLTGEQVSGAGHEISRGDTSGTSLIDRSITDINGIKDTNLRLNR